MSISRGSSPGAEWVARRVVVAAVGGAVALVIFGVWWDNRWPLHETPGEIRAAVLERVPVASTQHRAREVMSGAGFTCTPEGPPGEAKDFAMSRLYCVRSQQAFSSLLLVRRTVRVSFVLRGGRVEEVSVEQGLTGL